MSCERCNWFCERQRIDDPHFYRDVVRQLLDAIKAGVLEMTSGTCPLETLLDAQSPWPDDIVTHEMRCAQCGQRFVMSIDTYHGSGGDWRPAQ